MASKKKASASGTSSKKKEKATAIDGWGSVEKKKVRNAVRQIWQRSKQWRMVKARCTGEDGFYVCEGCGSTVPRISVDHTIAIGDIEDPGFLERLFVSSEGLKGLCDPCHKPKTKKDNAETKAKKEAKKKKDVEEFHIEDAHAELPLYIDPDIQAMDIYTHEKVKLQEERNRETHTQQHVSLDMFI